MFQRPALFIFPDGLEPISSLVIDELADCACGVGMGGDLPEQVVAILIDSQPTVISSNQIPGIIVVVVDPCLELSFEGAGLIAELPGLVVSVVLSQMFGEVLLCQPADFVEGKTDRLMLIDLEGVGLAEGVVGVFLCLPEPNFFVLLSCCVCSISCPAEL